jgi:hypothetical protein
MKKDADAGKRRLVSGCYRRCRKMCTVEVEKIGGGSVQRCGEVASKHQQALEEKGRRGESIVDNRYFPAFHPFKSTVISFSIILFLLSRSVILPLFSSLVTMVQSLFVSRVGLA